MAESHHLLSLVVKKKQVLNNLPINVVVFVFDISQSMTCGTLKCKKELSCFVFFFILFLFCVYVLIR